MRPRGRGPEAEAQRDETEVRDGCRGQECSGTDGHQDRGTEDAGESEVLAGQNAGGSAALARPSREEEGEHDDVVDVGRCEQAHRLQDRGEDHAPSPAASHPGSEQAESMHGASSSTARVASTSAVSACARCESAISYRVRRPSGSETTIPQSRRHAKWLDTFGRVRSRSRASSAG